MMHLSKPQKSIYNMEKFAGGSIAVICSSMLRSGTIELEVLEKSVNTLYRLNDVLRMRIIETPDGTRQTVSEYKEQRFQALTFEKHSEFLVYAADCAKQPIDMYGPLCDVKIIFVENQYGLLVKLHHIIGDAWTMTLLAKQFATILDGQVPETYSYLEYLQAEEFYMQSEYYQKDRKFFVEQFSKCDEATYLSEKQSDNYSADRKTITLTEEVMQQITGFAEKNKTSIFTVMMTLFGAYFSRIKMNAEKFYIGTPILNRTGRKQKATMGMFINTVPFLAEIENEKTFRENLQSAADNLMPLLRHQHYSYEELLSLLRSEYNFTNKLYDVLLSYQNAKTEAGDFQTEWYSCGMQMESLQIHIDDRDSKGVLTINYDYRTDCFTEKEIGRMHECLFRLFTDAVKNENKKICELEMLSESEKNKLLYKFNDTRVDYPKDKCVHQLFEEQVLKTPDKMAVIACDRTLTYDELNRLSNRIANALIEKNIGSGDIVAFALPRTSFLIAVMFGILKAGAAYLPVDPDYPEERIRYMLSDSKAKIFITEESIGDYISDEEKNPKLDITSDSLCYCIYTSGSTGNPKGTLLKHKNVRNYCENDSIIKNTYKTIVSITTVGFDIFVTESILPLVNGLTTVLADESQINIQKNLNQLLIRNSVDVLQTTPSKMNLLIADKKNCQYLNGLKVIMLGGEAFDLRLYNSLKQLTVAKVFNAYGPTETAIWSTNKLIENGDITIGSPIANTQIYILDKFNNLQPIGQIGELCIAGDGVCAGYLNRPELTAEKFVLNPFYDAENPMMGKIMYKTGDLAYWREDGNIVYVGRNDFQVKIRGLRIELGEIENAINSVEGVLQSVVVVRKDESGRQLICAFYTEQTQVETLEIKKSIGARLPKYMMPHIFTRLDAMPLTTSGKINRKALPEVNLHIQSDVEYVAPKTKKEKILIEAVESTLHVENISVLDNFIDMGGDSLKAIELISRLENGGYSADIKTIFSCETLRALAEELKEAKQFAERMEDVEDIPATDAQMRVYTAQNMQENSTLYNVPYCFETENLDPLRLQNAVRELINRHEIFRTHFEEKDGKIIQVIHETVNVEIERLNNADISDFIRPFDLSATPLMRIGYHENKVVVDMHHIITDGSSMPIFFHELNELYMGRELPNIPVPYKEFAIRKKEYAESEKYWLSLFGDEVPVFEVNTDFPRGQKQSFKGTAYYDSINKSLHNKINEKCKQMNITPYVFYMSGFYILLSKFSGNEDIIVGMPMIGRESRYLNTIGMFVNTIALRNKPAGTKSVREFLYEVKETSVNAIENQNYPFGELIKKLAIDIQDRNPLFDVMFAYQGEEMTNIIFGDKKATLLPVPIATSKYDLTFNLMPQSNDIVLMIEYCTDLYKESTIQRMIEGYKSILEQMLEEGNFIKDICVISETEKYKLLHAFNDTRADYPKDKCVHQLFEEQVLKTPDKMAIIACDRTLTYDELNRLSNRIANALIEKNIGNGDMVAFALPRTSCLIAVIFGILKTGAAYLPIDPEYPEERISNILTESRAVLLITSDILKSLLFNINETNPEILLCPGKIYCALHTSGSTGIPKLSLLTHRNIVAFMNLSKKFFENIDVTISVTIVTFDAFILESIISIVNNITLKLASEDEIYNQYAFEDMFVGRENIMLFSTPTKMKSYIQCSKTKMFLKRIKSFVIGGEVFTEELYNLIKDNTEGCNIFNIYGPTETTVCAVVDKLEGNDITIGKPIPNIQIYILDKYNSPKPIGQVGELCIAGDGVGAGYLNRPELTAEKFVPNPFYDAGNPVMGKIMYKTGDLAYWREDGKIVYVGRNDFQVKIRGLRIELEEIENAINSVEGVLQSVVVVRKDEGERQLICAFYTEQIPVEMAEIKKSIGAKLPKYMMPHIFIRLDAMPLTASGKISRKALPEVDLNEIDNAAEYERPVEETEKRLATLMEEVLHYAPIGRNENFFDIGGDSLRAIEFVSKAHNEGIYFSLQSVFDNPTVKELCTYIENGDKVTIQYTADDFSKYEALLAGNVMDENFRPNKCLIKSVFLTGATGFLGSHILDCFMEGSEAKIYCLVRGSEKRLHDTLRYYFGEKYKGSKRIIPVEGDFESLKNIEIEGGIDFVIHAGASVKHYGSYSYFYEKNVIGTRNVLDFAKRHNAKVVHVSTVSVSGNTIADSFDAFRSEEELFFSESSLYIGQPLDNVYARSKFEAEKAVLDAMLDGQEANIIRVGNLTNRYCDGKFQPNYKENAFAKRVKAVLEFGTIPDYLLPLYCEFSPIDDTARAIFEIVRYFNTQYTVFHCNSNKEVYFDKLIEYLHKLNIKMDVVSAEEFVKRLNTEGMEYVQEALINDMDENSRLLYDTNIRILNDFTVNYLKQLGFEWPEIGFAYVEQYVNYFKEIGYLEV